MLTQRLGELEERGVLIRRKLPPPASVQVYELTEWGYEAEVIVRRLEFVEHPLKVTFHCDFDSRHVGRCEETGRAFEVGERVAERVELLASLGERSQSRTDAGTIRVGFEGRLR